VKFPKLKIAINKAILPIICQCVLLAETRMKLTRNSRQCRIHVITVLVDY